MTIEEDVIAVLESADFDTYTGRVPTDVSFPYLVVTKITHSDLARAHDGTGMQRPRFQVDVWAETYQSCVETSEAVKGVLHLNQIDFKLSTRENELDLPEEDAGLYHRVLDFFIYI